jgi:hypothetical protein
MQSYLFLCLLITVAIFATSFAMLAAYTRNSKGSTINRSGTPMIIARAIMTAGIIGKNLIIRITKNIVNAIFLGLPSGTFTCGFTCGLGSGFMIRESCCMPNGFM